MSSHDKRALSLPSVRVSDKNDRKDRSGSVAATNAQQRLAQSSLHQEIGDDPPAALGRDVSATIKWMKTHFKNGMLARDTCIVILYRLNEDAGREWFLKFVHQQTGGVSILLSAMEHHLSDSSFMEVATQLLCTLLHFNGRKQVKVARKVVKKGGSRIVLSAINFHKAQSVKLFQSACTVLCSLIGLDPKVTTMSRLSGGLATLLSVIKANMGSKEHLVPALSCVCALCSKCDLNPQLLVKKGAVSLLADLAQRCVAANCGAAVVLKFVCKAISLVAKIPEARCALVKEGVVMSMFAILQHPNCDHIELQKLPLNIIRALAMDPTGMKHFLNMGGTQKIVETVLKGGANSSGDALLDVVGYLYKFHDLDELHLPQEEEVEFAFRTEKDDVDGADGEDVDYSKFSLELKDGDRDAPVEKADTNGDAVEERIQYVRPFATSRASPSCASVLSYSPDEIEPLHAPSPDLLTKLLQHELMRLTAPEKVMSVVVYDDVERTIDPPPKLFGRQEVGGQAAFDAAPSPPLTFSAAFESGNLKRAVRIYDTEYDLFLNSDVNSAYYMQWFFFSVEGMVPGQSYKFNIVNLEKSSSLFSEGQRPVLFSEREFTRNGVGWVRAGEGVMYFRNPYTKRDPLPADIDRAVCAERRKLAPVAKPTKGAKASAAQEARAQQSGAESDGHDTDVGSKRSAATNNAIGVEALRRLDTRSQGTYYTLTFAMTFEHPDDKVYLAASYPYTYSDLQRYLKLLPVRHPRLYDYYRHQTICKTVSKNPVPMLTITTLRREDGTPVPAKEIEKRKVCYITGRVHPGESCASWMVKGVIDTLIDQYSDHSRYLRDNLVWKIVPMLNPDGVINGNHRCSLTARDLNREWHTPSPALSPSIYYLKCYMKHVKREEGRNVLLFTDFHGHSKHRNFFMYGCNALKKQSTVTPSLILERVLPKILSTESPSFSYKNSSFNVHKTKESTGRVVVWKELGVRLSYTVEASMMGSDALPVIANDPDLDEAPPKPGHFNTEHYQSIGAVFCQALKPFVCAEGDPSILRLGDVVRQLVAEVQAASQPTAAARRDPTSRRASNYLPGKPTHAKEAPPRVNSLSSGDSAETAAAKAASAQRRSNPPTPPEEDDDDDDDDDDDAGAADAGDDDDVDDGGGAEAADDDDVDDEVDDDEDDETEAECVTPYDRDVEAELRELSTFTTLL
eukprot:TRINITY_DN1149_c0_g1_i3.p1 TRINITY_DN1149_c0_g1~~TRINITY_DN1149_c0_g1_i3.p1  ORF type:complete len:1191 (+),score=455.67 TRINITY_DN1149_c0_g1_i3:101-3673(+)